MQNPTTYSKTNLNPNHRLSKFTPASPDAFDDPEYHTIYVFVRTDISPEQRAVQAAHAAAESGRLYYDQAHGIASLVLLSARSEDELESISHHLENKDIDFTAFYEPDFGMGFSAIATRPVNNAERRIMMGWKLLKMAA